MFENMPNLVAAGATDNPMVIVGIVIAVVVVLFLIVRAMQKPEPPANEKADKPKDTKRPTKSVLEDRMEVDGPVEIDENMSLAEIKRAKSAKIKKKTKRETAVEATAKAKADHTEKTDEEDSDESGEVEAIEEEQPAASISTELEEGESLEDISMGWDDMLDDMGSEAEDAEPESEEEPEAEPEAEPDVDTSDVEEDESPDTDEEPDVEPESEPDAEVSEPEEEPAKDPIVETETSLEDGLAKTRTGFIAKLGSLFSKDTLDDDLVDEVEEVLFTADIGTTAAKDILHAIEERLDGDEKRDPAAVWAFVREYVEGILTARETKLDVESETPFVILVVGVNGVGKTTTIGKLASRYTKQGKSVMMVAGDTFRAAAVEQLGVWGERTGIPVHQGEPEADPASVIFEGIERGVEEGADVIICDTAGRLHTKVNLLKELEKIGRVAGKVIETAPHETILVLDANTGQNAIQQAKMFSEAVEISGIVLTKLDGTAKGGVVLGICEELDAPIRFIGIGEGVNDLREFDAGEFVEALFM